MTAKRGKGAKPGTSVAGAAARKSRLVDAFFAHNENKTQATIACGYSEKTARSIATKLFADSYVQDLIAVRRAELSRKMGLTAEEVLESAARDLRFDPALLYDEEGNLKKIRDMPPEVRLSLEGAEVESRLRVGKKGTDREGELLPHVTTAKVHYPKKHAVREQLMKHFGLFARDKQGAGAEDDGDAPPPVSVTIEFKDARRRG